MLKCCPFMAALLVEIWNNSDSNQPYHKLRFKISIGCLPFHWTQIPPLPANVNGYILFCQNKGYNS